MTYWLALLDECFVLSVSTVFLFIVRHLIHSSVESVAVSYARFLKLGLSRESRVIPGTPKQQRFSNIKSHVILGITRPALSRYYQRDKLGINSGQEEMAAQFDDEDDLWKLADSYVDLFPPRLSADPLTELDEVKFRTRFRDSDVL